VSDIFLPKKRSEIMSKIRVAGTKPEKIVRKFLIENGLHFSKNSKLIKGKPDIVLSKYKTVIFVNGCFWHGHKNCKASKLPETRKNFWKTKINGNIIRDKKNIKELKKLGYTVMIIWQCSLKNKRVKEKTLNKILLKLDLIKKETI
jgi:DNA mismatch endonuclease, patch repair protein